MSEPQIDTPPPSRALAGIAAALPFVFTIGACGLYAVAIPARGAGPEALWHSLRDMGLLSALVILAITCVSALGIGACLFFAGRGARLPTAVPLGLATLPWLASMLVEARGLETVWAAVEYAAPAQRAALMSAGMAESIVSRLFGAALASALCAATALGLGLAALGQRAPRRSIAGALIGGALTLPLLGLAAYALLAARGAAIVLVAALGAVLASSIAGLGIGADAPKARSAALGASAPIAGGLAVTLAVAMAWSASLAEMFSAIAYAAAEDRGRMVALGIDELGPLAIAAYGALPVALFAALALAGFSLTRARPSAGRIAGALALLAVVAVAIGSDALLSSLARSRVETLTRAPWADARDFAPVTLSERVEDVEEEPAFLLTPAGLTEANGTSVATFDPSALARALASQVRDPGALPELDSPYRLAEDPSVVVALDERVTAAGLRAFFDALATAGARSVELQGVASSSLDDDERERVARASPMFAAAFTRRGAVTVVVGGSVPPSTPLEDPILRHATVGASAPDQLEVRPGASVEDRSLTGRSDGGLEPVYLAIGDGATAASLADACARARQRGLTPVVVTGAVPGLDRPVPTESDRGFGERVLRGRASLGDPGDESGAGLFDTSLVTRALRTRMRAIQSCYERELRGDPTLAGRVVVSFTVQPSGSVTGAAATENATGSDAVASCVVSTVSRLHFNPGPEGGSVTYQYPFTFAPQP